MPPSRPSCAVCPAPVRWKIELTDLTKDAFRITELCGKHSRPLRSQPVSRSWRVTKVTRIEYGGAWR